MERVVHRNPQRSGWAGGFFSTLRSAGPLDPPVPTIKAGTVKVFPCRGGGRAGTAESHPRWSLSIFVLGSARSFVASPGSLRAQVASSAPFSARASVTLRLLLLLLAPDSCALAAAVGSHLSPPGSLSDGASRPGHKTRAFFRPLRVLCFSDVSDAHC